MEAKDTVMKELAPAIIKHPELPMGQAIAIEQAEITGAIMYKAGYEEGEVKAYIAAHKAGMKEVVDWVEAHDWYCLGIKAKLKEWGL